MPRLSSVLLFLLALSASADCTSRVLLRTNGPMVSAQMDEGRIYFQLFGERAIQRETGTAFTLDDPFQSWYVERGTITISLSQTQLLLVAPDGSRRTIDQPAAVRGLRTHGGYLYWVEANGDLRRALLSGGPAETVVIGRASDAKFYYLLLEDRIVFLDSTGLFWQPFGGVPLLLLPRTDIGINEVTAEGVYVSTKSPWDPNVSTAQILRVPWSGAPVETIYEKTVHGYVPELSAGAIVSGATTYIIESRTEHFFWRTSTLLVQRHGATRERYSAAIAPFTVLDADEDSIVLGQWINAGGMRQIVRVCADQPKTRAAR